MKRILSPFKWYCLENFPFIEAYIDAYDEYQLLGKLFELVNKNNEKVNAMGVQVENLTDFVNTYFADLDVQEEINNKLNEMAESGELAEIISQYLALQVAFTFNNVQEMKNAENLIEGSIAQTLGFYSVNDGGNAIYKIRTVTTEDIVDNMFLIPLQNINLVAELIIGNEINPLKIGAKGNGISDDTIFLQASIDKGNLYKINLGSIKNKYLISQTLNITKTLIIEGNYSQIIGDIESLININITENDERHGIIKNIEFNNNYGDNAIKITYCKNFTIENCKITNTLLGLNYIAGYELTINNCLFRNINNEDETTINKLKNSIGLKINTSDSHFTDIIITNFHKGIEVNESGNMYTRVHGWIAINDLVADSIFFDCSNGGMIGTECFNDSYYIGWKVENRQQIHLTNCRNFWNSTYYNINNINVPPYIFYFDNYISSQGISIYNMTSSEFLFENNKPLFSNIEINEWINYKNIINNCSYVFSNNIDKVPNGKITQTFNISSGYNVTTNELIISETGTKGRIHLELTKTGTITANTDYLIATNTNLKIPVSTLIPVYQKTDKWSSNIVVTYGYVQANGEIRVKLSDTTKPFILIDYEYNRTK